MHSNLSGWQPEVKAALQNLLEKAQNKSNPYAVFDWDNTCIYGDVTETLFIYQIDNLRYKLTPWEFSGILSIALKDNFSGESPVEKHAEQISSDLLEDYTFLYEHYIVNQKMSLEKIRETEEFNDFKAKMFYFYLLINDHAFTKDSFLWMMYLYSNMTAIELENLSKESIDFNLHAERKCHLLSSSPALSKKTGVLSAHYTGGLRINPLVVHLFQELKAKGIGVYVCSASAKEVLIPLVTYQQYGYALPQDHLLAVRLDRDSCNVLQPRIDEAYPITFKTGKMQAIEQFLVSKLGTEPMLVAGDSTGDYYMMTGFPGLELALVMLRSHQKSVELVRRLRHEHSIPFAVQRNGEGRPGQLKVS
ncbi:hypothetical protein [Zhaonella formicivorans]|uniref:hypothetical protein n=1 Tax=Zhaonella formicivorans TaxID=2528593 RepID=UPI0010E775EF|nr:hypothetical protein [Zhaonella formicivorans]